MSLIIGKHGIVRYGIYLDGSETERYVTDYGRRNAVLSKYYGGDDSDDSVDVPAAKYQIADDLGGQFLDYIDGGVEDFLMFDLSGVETGGDESGLFLPCTKHGSIVASDTEGTYADMGEFVGELRDTYGWTLPSDFDYAGHVRMLCASVIDR
jgi:hypothetical protein